MKSKEEQERILAVERFHNGEKPESTCASLGKSKPWLYKWVKHRKNLEKEESWHCDQFRHPVKNVNRTSTEIEEVVKMVRLNLYNRELFCGAQAIL